MIQKYSKRTDKTKAELKATYCFLFFPGGMYANAAGKLSSVAGMFDKDIIEYWLGSA